MWIRDIRSKERKGISNRVLKVKASIKDGVLYIGGISNRVLKAAIFTNTQQYTV